MQIGRNVLECLFKWCCVNKDIEVSLEYSKQESTERSFPDLEILQHASGALDWHSRVV